MEPQAPAPASDHALVEHAVLHVRVTDLCSNRCVFCLEVAKPRRSRRRHVDRAEVAAHEVRMPLTVNRVSADEASAAVPDAEVPEEIVILKAAKAAERARELADRGDLEQAERSLRAAVEELTTTARGSARAEELLEQASFWEARSERLAARAYDSLERKRMYFQERSTRERRRKEPPPEAR